MNRTRLTVLLIAAGALVGGALLYCSSPAAVARREREVRLEAARSGTEPARPAAGHRALTVDALQVQRRARPVMAEIPSSLKPVRAVSVAAEVEGRVVSVDAVEHAPIEAGATLLRLDPTLLEAAVRRAEAALVRASASRRFAKLELERQRGLAERRIASPAELDRAEREERTSWAVVADAEASLSEARAWLEKTRIRAPFAGVVSWLDLEVGAYLRPGDRVAEIVDISGIEIEVGVTDRQVVALHAGDRVQVEVDVWPGEEFTGEIYRIGRAADDQTQQYPVEILLPNPEEQLLPGMLGLVKLRVGADRRVLQLPRRAVTREFEVDYVFVLVPSADGRRVERRRIVTRGVPFRPDLLEVTQGLESGEWLAVSRVRELREGQRVEFRGDPLDASAAQSGLGAGTD